MRHSTEDGPADHLAEVRDIVPLGELPPAEQRRGARAAWLANPELSGAALGRMYNRDARWGRHQIEAASRQAGRPAPQPPPGAGEAPETASPAGHAPPPPPPMAPTEHGEAGQEVDEAPGGGTWWERAGLAVGRLGVFLVAAALSYGHMAAAARAAGEDEWAAAVWPLSVDGLLVVALVTLRGRRRAGEAPGAAAVTALVLSLGASLAANVSAAEPHMGGWLVAGWPPIALAVIEWMSGRRGRR